MITHLSLKCALSCCREGVPRRRDLSLETTPSPTKVAEGEWDDHFLPKSRVPIPLPGCVLQLCDLSSVSVFKDSEYTGVGPSPPASRVPSTPPSSSWTVPDPLRLKRHDSPTPPGSKIDYHTNRTNLLRHPTIPYLYVPVRP